MCQAGCIDIDPNPDSAGIFIGASSPEQCTVGTDTDLDSLIDFCEKNLIQAFAPELDYAFGDEVGMEAKWAAQWMNDSTVRLIYLLSYYRDAGSSAFICSVPPPAPTQSCFGHNGDSEHLTLDVSYHATSSHWVLSHASYSQHDMHGIYRIGSAGFPSIQYPDKQGGYPKVWVSEGKHANYSSQSGCNAGGFLGVDTCVDVDWYVRVSVPATANIGSRLHHTSGQDCWISTNPSYQYYGSGRTECYWTSKQFRGWIPDSVGGMGATWYSTILDEHNF
jgi:hypothetical protein